MWSETLIIKKKIELKDMFINFRVQFFLNMRKTIFLWIALIFSLLVANGFVNLKKKGDKKLPNILLAISDDQSYPHAGIYGCQAVYTPGFDKVATEGILFNNAFSAAPGCSPSRASLLTGKYIWELEDAGSHASYFPAKFVTYTDLLDSIGYHVGYTGKGWGPGRWKESGRVKNPAGTAYNEMIDTRVPEHIRQTDYFENFKLFLESRDKNQPFCFWYGASEPHRRYKTGIGLENNMDIEEVVVPGFLPDVDEVRADMLDYLYEIQHFDLHLGKMIDLLEEMGELDNTCVIVTSDNGMPFPRAKANLYEYGFHMPLAIRWGDQIKPSRVVNDLISLTDVAPTIVDMINYSMDNQVLLKHDMSGISFLDILLHDQQGLLEPDRSEVYSARERHSCSRWKNLSYPIRVVRTHHYLYIKNFKPERWPAGAPVKFSQEKELTPGFHDIDDFQENYIYLHRDVDSIKYYFDLAVARRPMEELYDITKDPYCLNDLSCLPEYQEKLIELRKKLNAKLMETADPRATGNGDIWETYKRFNVMRSFPVPDWGTVTSNQENK
jgi:uncharacterized sulfatase